jgi:hypothetical protein
MRKINTKAMPAVQAPAPEIEDRKTVRFGSANVAAEMPPLKRPAPEVADRGSVRLGSANVTAERSA